MVQPLQLHVDPKLLERALEQCTRQTVELRFGVNTNIAFMPRLAEFLKNSQDYVRSEAYVGEVYRAVSNLQMHILNGIPNTQSRQTLRIAQEAYKTGLASAKQELETLLYDTQRAENIGGMQSSKLFVDRVCEVATKVRRQVIGDTPVIQV